MPDETSLNIYIDSQLNKSISISGDRKVYSSENMNLYFGASRPEETASYYFNLHSTEKKPFLCKLIELLNFFVFF